MGDSEAASKMSKNCPRPQRDRKRLRSRSPLAGSDRGLRTGHGQRKRRGCGGRGFNPRAPEDIMDNSEDPAARIRFHADSLRLEIVPFNIFDGFAVKRNLKALRCLKIKFERDRNHCRLGFRSPCLQQLTRFIELLKWFHEDRFQKYKTESAEAVGEDQARSAKPPIMEIETRPGTVELYEIPRMVDAETQTNAVCMAPGAMGRLSWLVRTLKEQEKQCARALLELHLNGMPPSPKDLLKASTKLAEAQTALKTAKAVANTMAGYSLLDGI